MKKELDYRLYLVTDRDCLKGRDFLSVLESALAGGVTLVQLREKDAGGAFFLEQAILAKQLCDRYQVPLLINDRVDVALACNAAGVHLGQSDLPLKAARKLLGTSATIGISVHTITEALQAATDGADYLGVGAVFPTQTKTDATDCNLQVLEEIVRKVKIPVVGIGGINQENYLSVLQTGAVGAAVVSAILAQDDVQKAVETFNILEKKSK
ncbi:MAG TPA: thiamine phosphate synthase [Candidatus Avacidaminococcus intestinavium]|uniref:Thiamine-phosphate synthase n=1 Tax=Candidatus Avacidaminococcus intestinavium TaxID=2840684 RepID=A0A9D1MP65_9FIRM|nr:thiamine phosphate synthase [Candidatus Avacidaminococcus intestinavium]